MEASNDLALFVEKNEDYLAATASVGLKEHGRGAVVIWEPEGATGFAKFTGSYMPTSAPAFRSTGPHVADILDTYNLAVEYVVVFISGSSAISAVVAPLPKAGYKGDA
jgi:hypothetical protein